MVIVTQNQYILAQKIHHVIMDEQLQHLDYHGKNGRTYTRLDRYYQITVIYTPEASQSSSANSGFGSSSGNRGDEIKECTVLIRSATRAHLIFKNLIQQIREQMPDQLYLDTALEKMLSGVDLEGLKVDDQQYKDLEELDYDISTKEVRKPRKTKRTNQKVLRGAKRKR